MRNDFFSYICMVIGAHESYLDDISDTSTYCDYD